MKAFMDRSGAQVKGVIGGWDRLAFRGTLRWLSSVAGMRTYLIRTHILLKDFSDWEQSLTARVRQSCQEVAEGLGVPTLYLRSSALDKDSLALAVASGR